MKTEQSSRHTQGSKRSFRWLLAASMICTLIIGVAAILWINHGKTTYWDAHSHYQAGDCQAAIPMYSQIERYPAWAGSFVAQAEQEHTECLALEEARDMASAGNESAAIQAYEAFLAEYKTSSLTPLATEAIKTEYMAWGESLHDTGEFEAALATYEQLTTGYPEYEPEASERSQATYLDWAMALRQAGDYEGAVAVYDELAIVYPDLAEMIDDLLLETYLAWGEAAHRAGAWAEAVAVYDEMAARGPAFAHAAQDPRSQTYVAWGAALLTNGDYAPAEQVQRTLLQREHERLAPLPVPDRDWRQIWPYPYGLAKITFNQFTRFAHTGPDSEYELAQPPAGWGSLRHVPIVGASPDDLWVAVSAASWANPPGEPPDFAMRDVAWQQEAVQHVVWFPASEIDLELAGEYGIPLAGPFVHALAETSAPAAQALTGLQETYAAWAEAELAAGTFDQAAAHVVALADLATDEAAQRALWARVSQIHLQAAEVLATEGQHTASITQCLQAEDYASQTLLAARKLRIGNSLALGDLAADARDWETAVDHYGDALVLERETFGMGEALVAKADTSLFVTPALHADVIHLAEKAKQFRALARSEADQAEDAWVLLLVPSVPQAMAWLPTEQVTLTFPVTDLPAFDTVDLPPLNSHAAFVGLVGALQAQGQDLCADGDYEHAIELYEIILSEAEMQAVVTGTSTLAAQAWVSWGNSDLDEGHILSATRHFVHAWEAAPESAAASEAIAALSAMMDDLEQADNRGCDEVSVLDRMIGTPLEERALALLPATLYQCGNAELNGSALGGAQRNFQRILDEFPKSKVASKARTGLQTVEWHRLVGLHGNDAANVVCNEAGDTTQARLSTLHTPHVFYIHDRGNYFPVWLVDATWPDGSKKPFRTTLDSSVTVLVCVDEWRMETVQTCSYTGGYTLHRMRQIIEIRIVDPISQRTVIANRMVSKMPEACPQEYSFSPDAKMTVLSGKWQSGGTKVQGSDLVSFLAQYIK